MITSQQLRAARALLHWEQKDLAEAARVSLPLIQELEAVPGQLEAESRAIDAVVNAIQSAGVSFLDGNYSSPGGPGVRFSQPAGTNVDTTEDETIQYREFYENDAPPGAGG
ncbi:transcriptional regulator with XRE-family HTH domain [Rhizobium sp. BK196]|jgi:hypothetical protein|uniref:helix-turn-helix transcriptional regulator n=1 Tax=unclassified Rhizobium TaxID=2613769 RepID=UPI001617DC8E|nr:MULTISPECIES: helix-turn-helix transcriptional regulator [unclassified Rhizobium]MBB3312474.1 transcriptional regulator with XRE-family HTH domain [Rhizobium sp. BK196]MBB3463284.1 transcriptional regulator with XRE-family HTH domain [Rhizobium sp. BK377]